MDFTTWPPKVLVVDTEGSGTSLPDLVELAAVPITAGTVRADAIRQSLVRPPNPVTPRAAALNGLTDQILARAPAWETIAEQVRADLDCAWLVAHNASVDYRLLARLLPGWEPAGVICTLRLARALRPDLPRHTLDALLAAIPVPPVGVTGLRHRAAYDAHATALLLLALVDPLDAWADVTAIGVPAALRSVQTDQQNGLW
ncbi:DNA polymerase-3 subunit epsilon/exodeoxyribonuclease X [Kitasatospora gansuensis]|uniref:DNA polymerase-3 subunit epsilon/exodeoxyribonuclease X n=1 Tax=Kitasatospora gansuensis TaxID=258050 RepID=A0A7W7SFJ3_9ACTN|nr:3'-5' exonuclease [Kitasatospora gansuensis]MBB4949509.1 DNA polymerase-3 subunit epsilon/exodeoxyribonuclease X [Kitasatospora gansuensis]